MLRDLLLNLISPFPVFLPKHFSSSSFSPHFSFFHRCILHPASICDQVANVWVKFVVSFIGKENPEVHNMLHCFCYLWSSLCFLSFLCTFESACYGEHRNNCITIPDLDPRHPVPGTLRFTSLLVHGNFRCTCWSPDLFTQLITMCFRTLLSLSRRWPTPNASCILLTLLIIVSAIATHSSVPNAQSVSLLCACRFCGRTHVIDYAR